MAATPDAPLQTRIVDDKSPICIPFILSRLQEHRKQQQQQEEKEEEEEAAGQALRARPFIVGLNGVQGVGKTTLVRALAETLQGREGLSTLVVSIDDFYLPHADQLVLAAAHPDNALVQHRGEPGTHDIPLLQSFLSALLQPKPDDPTPIRIPRYDKSAFSGLGDRLPPSAWPTAPAHPQVLILEGWCVGFRPLDAAALEARWRRAAPSSRTLLRQHKLEHLRFVNDSLRAYDAAVTARLDAFVHVDAEDLSYVYAWRLEQEAQLRRERGAGMSDEQVVRFVDAYYPAYELFTDGVRRGIFGPERPGRQLRLVVGRDRSVKETMVI